MEYFFLWGLPLLMSWRAQLTNADEVESAKSRRETVELCPFGICVKYEVPETLPVKLKTPISSGTVTTVCPQWSPCTSTGATKIYGTTKLQCISAMMVEKCKPLSSKERWFVHAMANIEDSKYKEGSVDKTAQDCYCASASVCMCSTKRWCSADKCGAKGKGAKDSD